MVIGCDRLQSGRPGFDSWHMPWNFFLRPPRPQWLVDLTAAYSMDTLHLG
jgi:hypothetical protein